MSIDNEFAQPPRLLPRTIEDQLRAWMVRGAGAALIICACLIWGAMLTWSANDPSLSINTAEPAQNLLGLPGAMIADFFFHTLGLSVVFFVVPPLVLGLQIVFGDTVTDHRRRLFLFAVATVGIAGGCSALPITQQWPMELGYGGILGDFVYSLTGSILAHAHPQAGGAIAGALFFALGFWAFSRAACLDRYNIFDVGPFTGLARFRGSIGTRNRQPRAAENRHRTAAPLDGSKRFAEPEPPHWTLNARIHEYAEDNMRVSAERPPVRMTAGGDGAFEGYSGDTSTDDRAEADAFSQIAARFAASPPPFAGQDAIGRDTNEHQTILLNDDISDGAPDGRDDLPNVLKRARQEAVELLAPTLAQRLGMGGATPARGPAVAMSREPVPGPDARMAGYGRGQSQTTQGPRIVAKGYRRPSFNLLKSQKAAPPSADSAPPVLAGRARMLEDVLADFRIKGDIRDVRPGPVITLFELEPARGTKSARVIALADDVARSMSAQSARIAIVPGRNAIGIELPNTRRELFGLRELIDSQEFLDSGAKLPLVLGKGIGGEPVLADLARMPHLLVAGTTGSGKSVGVNAMILSLIYRLGPEECRFLMIDPKMLELSSYNGIPHLLTPVITDPQKAITALAWAVAEMEERYKRMAELGVRSIDAFNNRVRQAAKMGEKLGRTVQTGFDPATGEAVFEETTFDAGPLPHIVIVVDEFADLMAVAGKEIEGLVQRLAQMARAAGMHMIMATQRPSVDVVTGTIKANFPTRISYRVASRIDSRTILNEQGGEQLLGQGDMLFLNESGSVQRVHGPFVSDEEVEAVTTALKGMYATDYIGDILAEVPVGHRPPEIGAGDSENDLYQRAVEIVLSDKKASTSYLQRRLAIGYNRAADLIDRMEAEGVIGAANHSGRRDILMAG